MLNPISKAFSDSSISLIRLSRDSLLPSILPTLMVLVNHGLKPAFFYGVSDSQLTIDEAASQSSIPDENDNFEVSTCREIPESALWTIWQIAQFPKDYDEPIKGKFPQEMVEEMGPNWISHRSLFEYLKHKRKYSSIGGELVKMKKD